MGTHLEGLSPEGVGQERRQVVSKDFMKDIEIA